MVAFLPIIGAIATRFAASATPNVVAHITAVTGGITGTKIISGEINHHAEYQQTQNDVFSHGPKKTFEPLTAKLVPNNQNLSSISQSLTDAFTNAFTNPLGNRNHDVGSLLQFIYNPVVKPGVRINTLPMTPPGDQMKIPGMDGGASQSGIPLNEGFSIVRPNTTTEGFTSSLPTQKLGGYQSINTNAIGDYLHLSSSLNDQGGKFTNELAHRSNEIETQTRRELQEGIQHFGKRLRDETPGITTEEFNLITRILNYSYSPHNNLRDHFGYISLLAHQKNVPFIDDIGNFTKLNVVHTDNLQTAYKILLEQSETSINDLANQLAAHLPKESLNFGRQHLSDLTLMDAALASVDYDMHQLRTGALRETYSFLADKKNRGTLPSQIVESLDTVTNEILTRRQNNQPISLEQVSKVLDIYLDTVMRISSDGVDRTIPSDPNVDQLIQELHGIEQLYQTLFETRNFLSTVQTVVQIIKHQ